MALIAALKNDDIKKDGERLRDVSPCISECERLFNIFYKYLTTTSLAHLFNENKDFNNRNQKLTIIECYRLLEHMSDNDQRGLALKFCIENLQMCEEVKSKQYEFEEMLTFIINKLYKNQLLHHFHCFELHVQNTDYKLKIPIDKKKFNFMKENMHLLDYKEKRNIMKSLLVEKLEQIPMHLTEIQRLHVLPIEELILEIIDRENNYIPPLFTITEVFRLTRTSTAYFFPRVSKKLVNMMSSFRPLAEMITPIGRPWLFPIIGHIGFNNSNSTWKLTEGPINKIISKAHLPYTTEYTTMQSYFLYVILKQPRGNASLKTMIPKTNSLGPNNKLNITEILNLFILEGMYECEITNLPTHHPAVQYTWLNLQHLTEFCLFHGNVYFLDLLKLLKKSLIELKYRKAKDELMWLFLQHVTISVGKFQRECMVEIAEIYKILYTGNEAWVGSSLDVMKMIKFFAPAAIWICYEKDNKEEFPKPSFIIKNHMELFKKEAEKGSELHDGMLIVIGNAISTDKINFQEKFFKVLMKQLQGNEDEEKWLLPYGRKVDKRLKAIELTSLDCFTFHAKDMTAKHLMHLLGPSSPPLFTISPAIIESLMRMMLSVEVFDLTKIQFLNLISFYIKNDNLDFTYVIAEAICFRIIDVHIHYSQRLIAIRGVIESLKRLISHDSSNLLYSILEQVFIRSFIWYNQHDMCQLLIKSLTEKLASITSHICSPVSQYTGNIEDSSMLIAPEIVKMLYFTFLKNIKLTGIDVPIEITKTINEYYKFSPTILKFFSTNPDEFVSPIVLETTNNDFLVELVANDPLVKELKYPEEYLSKPKDKYILFCIIFKFLEDNPKADFNGNFYKILAHFNPKELTLSCNTFIEYLNQRFKNIEKDESEKLIKIVNDMIFKYQVTTFDKFLLSLIMHPNDDENMIISLDIIFYLISTCNDLQQNLNFCLTFIPRREFICRADSEKFFKKMVIYHKNFPEYTFKELLQRLEKKEDFIIPEMHLPIFYKNLAELIIPTVDMMLTNGILLNYNFERYVVILKTFSPIYAYHPCPLTFIYEILFLLNCEYIKDPALFQLFTRKIISISESVKSFTVDFYQSDVFYYPSLHATCTELVGKLIEACNIKLIPPKHVARDWRFSEFPPAGQALHSGAIELMFCNYPPHEVAECLLNIAIPKAGENYHEKINAACSLLTALPMKYQDHIFSFMQNAITSKELVCCKDPQLIFTKIEDIIFHCHDIDSIPHLAVIQTFWQLASMTMYDKGIDFFVEVLVDLVTNESQLLYAARIILPFIVKMSEAKEKFKKDETIRCTSALYDMIGNICSNTETQVVYKSVLCDIMYFIKYMFIGDVLKEKAEDVIKKMPNDMQELMKFYNSTGSNTEASRKISTTNISLLSTSNRIFQRIQAPLHFEEISNNHDNAVNSHFDMLNTIQLNRSVNQQVQQGYDNVHIKSDNVENRTSQPQEYKGSQLQQHLLNSSVSFSNSIQGNMLNMNQKSQIDGRGDIGQMSRNDGISDYIMNSQKMPQIGMSSGQGVGCQNPLQSGQNMFSGDPRLQTDIRLQQKQVFQHQFNMHQSLQNKQAMSHLSNINQNTNQPMNPYNNPSQYPNMMHAQHNQGIPPYNQHMSGKQSQMQPPPGMASNFNMPQSMNPYNNPQQFPNMMHHSNIVMHQGVQNPHNISQQGISPIYPQPHMYQGMPNQQQFPPNLQGHGYNQQRM
ncbi:Mediator of RNA polymerase II transcription subunit 23 [Strongyloides ratti]|uniref:Mediator of RNA polymerase II transcription subunit 23 n=1 Tax=Strongyloides ratti TaxID=34506 RepID=A0A090LJN7_STRRB|nr:Mediator of RNA polymerase II transcription subunit 23 [Strongyloides ratti]CEF67715.1 Mediator of RNA polymerase II transcription subunit 23 [Strongyloides ratti]